MSATVISFEDFNKSKSEAIEQAATVTRRPVSVLVHWSESGDFENETEYSFKEFEKKALYVALGHADGGYLKTKVTVKFDDGETYGCRIDLALNDERGFEHRCKEMISYSETPNGASYYGQDNWAPLLAFIKQIDFGSDEDLQAAQVLVELRKKSVLEEKQAAELAEKQAREAAKAAADAAYQEFKADLVIPEDAKAVIVAEFTEYDDERSDPYADYDVNKTTKIIILAWSKHTRDLFSEMRKAALNHPETAFLNDTEQSTEHREKYSMGKGYYLTNKGYIYNGVKIYKQVFYRQNKADCVPMGLIAIPKYQGKTPKAPALPAITLNAQEKPKFKAVNTGEAWRVNVSFNTICATYHNVLADSMAGATRTAWAAYVAEFAPFGPLPQTISPDPKDCAPVPEVASLDAVRDSKDAERAAGDLLSAALSAELIPYYSAAIAALAVSSSKIVRLWIDENRFEAVDRETLIGAAGRVRFNVERLSPEITRLIDDTVYYDLYHPANCGALIAAVEAESAHNLKIKEQNAAPFAAAFGAFVDGIEQRRERLEQRAARVSAESDRRYQLAHSAASAIPFGQPILVGHHSERADRNRRARIHDNFGKAFALADKADYLAEKAENLGSGGISSADPAAVLKLTEQLTQLEKAQEKMKRANALIRAGKESQLSELGFSEAEIEQLLNPRHHSKKGFQAFTLQNNNANIKRIRDRIRTLAVNQTPADGEPLQCGQGVITREDGRICIEFDGKPSDEIRTLLKSNAYKWAPSRKKWVRIATANAIAELKYLTEKLAKF